MPDRQCSPGAAVLHQAYVEEGLTVAAVADRFGVSTGLAHKWLLRAGVPMRPRPSVARTDVDEEEVCRLYIDRGWTAAEIADELGCGLGTVYRRLQGMGVTRRSPGSRKPGRPADSALAELLVRQRLSVADVAERFSVSPQAVYGWVRAAGIRQPRRPSPQRRAGCCPTTPIFAAPVTTIEEDARC